MINLEATPQGGLRASEGPSRVDTAIVGMQLGCVDPLLQLGHVVQEMDLWISRAARQDIDRAQL